MSDFPNSIRLPAPVRISEQVWPEGTVPVVSVFCITYNHVNFIRDAIEGFLMQETTFPVEIFIHDDASTDGTAEIVKEYAEKYPKLFWTVLQTENQWSKGKANAFFCGLMQKQRGEFVALCEGDDYWIAKEKLQKQVEVLEGDHKLVGCCHEILSNLIPNNGSVFVSHFSHLCLSQRVDLNYLLHSNVVATSSAIFRRKQACFPQEAFEGLAMGDWPMWIVLAKNGDFWFDSTPRSFYRVHPGGVWSSTKSEKGEFESLKMLSKMSHYIDKKYEDSGVLGIIKYYLPFWVRIFLHGDEAYFGLAHDEAANCAWDKDKIRSQLARSLMSQNILGIQGSRLSTFRVAWTVSTQLRDIFKKTNNSNYCAALASSIIGQAWSGKLKRPLFSVWLILLALRVSFYRSILSLAEMAATTFGWRATSIKNGYSN